MKILFWNIHAYRRPKNTWKICKYKTGEAVPVTAKFLSTVVDQRSVFRTIKPKETRSNDSEILIHEEHETNASRAVYHYFLVECDGEGKIIGDLLRDYSAQNRSQDY